jgi:hypothetical protein
MGSLCFEDNLNVFLDEGVGEEENIEVRMGTDEVRKTILTMVLSKTLRSSC